MRSSGTSHPVELEVHERINYLNNKAEKGEYWRGHQNAGQGDQENLVPSANHHDDKTGRDHSSNQSEDVANLCVHHSECAMRNMASVDTVMYPHPKYPTIRLPPVATSEHQKNVTDATLSDPVYVNHQFEKVAQRYCAKIGTDNCAYQVDGQLYKNKALREMPAKPVPAPRKNKKVSPSDH